MPESPTRELPNQQATEALGARLAALAHPGDAILLAGPIGAGKTTLARAFLRAAADDPALEVPSPTFTLVQTYDLPHFRAHHFDLWRLRSTGDLDELGWDDAQSDVVLVEWPERLGDHPSHALTVRLTPHGEASRTVTLSGWEDRFA